MEERKFIKLKKEEFGIKEAVRRNLGMGKISRLDIEYTPVGEKIIISTSKPGLVIGRRGEKIEELTRLLKKRFKLENPHIEINEIENPLFDSQVVADDIAMALERMGNLKFKVIAYRKLQEIINAGALGCELRVTGKLPSERARSWRFAQGYLKKAGESRKEIDRAESTALTKTGIIGIKVAIMAPTARVYDKINIDDKMKAMIKGESQESEEKDEKISKKTKKKTSETVKKILKSNEKTKQKASESKPAKSSKIDKIGKTKVIDESDNLKLKPEEDGTAMLVAEELEEGVPGDQIDKDINEDIKKEKVDKPKKTKESKK
jgi:small subunit ribosomal protein S3